MSDAEVVFECGSRVPLPGLPPPFVAFFRRVAEKAPAFKTVVDWEPQSYCALQAMQFFSGNTGKDKIAWSIFCKTIANMRKRVANVAYMGQRERAVSQSEQLHTRANQSGHRS